MPLLKGTLSYMPNFASLVMRERTGTISARYCYSVYLRHLCYIHEQHLNTAPKRLIEVGPGASLGMGLAAMLTGTDEYWALDVVKHISTKINLAVLDELIQLFNARAPIPDGAEFSELKPALRSYAFPHHILTAERLKNSMSAQRLAAIKAAVSSIDNDIDRDSDVDSDSPSTNIKNANALRIWYVVPWNAATPIPHFSADAAFAHVALQQIDSPQSVYSAVAQWLKPGGYLSHQIDYRSHGLGPIWNDHWTYPKLAWKVVRGTRPYYWNRYAHSDYLKMLDQAGLDVAYSAPVQGHNILRRNQLASEFKHLSDADLVTSGAFVLAQQPKQQKIYGRSQVW